MTDNATQAADILKSHRASIDRLDAILVYTLGERFSHTKAVGQIKANHDLPASDPNREVEQITRLKNLAQNADFVYFRKKLPFSKPTVSPRREHHF